MHEVNCDCIIQEVAFVFFVSLFLYARHAFSCVSLFRPSDLFSSSRLVSDSTFSAFYFYLSSALHFSLSLTFLLSPPLSLYPYLSPFLALVLSHSRAHSWLPYSPTIISLYFVANALVPSRSLFASSASLLSLLSYRLSCLPVPQLLHSFGLSYKSCRWSIIHKHLKIDYLLVLIFIIFPPRRV